MSLSAQPLTQQWIGKILHGDNLVCRQCCGDACTLTKYHPDRLDADGGNAHVGAGQDHGDEEIGVIVGFGENGAVRNVIGVSIKLSFGDVLLKEIYDSMSPVCNGHFVSGLSCVVPDTHISTSIDE